MNERMCIVTRESRPAGELIRFVVGPDGVLVPDLDAQAAGPRRLGQRRARDAVTRQSKKKAVRQRPQDRGDGAGRSGRR